MTERGRVKIALPCHFQRINEDEGKIDQARGNWFGDNLYLVSKNVQEIASVEECSE